METREVGSASQAGAASVLFQFGKGPSTILRLRAPSWPPWKQVFSDDLEMDYSYREASVFYSHCLGMKP